MRIYHFLLLLLLTSCTVNHQAQDKLDVLLFSGKNNHNWKQTTPALQKILEESGRFEVTVTEKPGEINKSMLEGYDVIVSNWNTYPERNADWPGEAMTALQDFINEGGGFVFVHAASSAQYDNEFYQNMAGATWAKGTHHGKVAPFEVEIEDIDHPVTNGMSNFWITDELWIDMVNLSTANVLAKAFAPKSNKGNDELEPVIFEQTIGKGRSFYLVLGHDARVMKNIGFKTLLCRASEWAATGEVTQELPSALQKRTQTGETNFEFKENENSLSLYDRDQLIWTYNFKKSEGKPYFHPLNTLDGTTLSGLRPEDHPWHRGIWFSWKYINGLNYWEEDRSTGISEGLTEITSIQHKIKKKKGAKIDLELSYHPPKEEAVLKEERSIFISIPEADSYYIEWESTFTAMAEEVVLDRTPLPHEPNGKNWGGYAGFSARLGMNLWDAKVYNDKEESKNLHGTKAPFLKFTARGLNGKTHAITIFDNPENPGYPNKWYVSQSHAEPFYYFSPCILFDQKMTLKKGETLKLKYRMLVE